MRKKSIIGVLIASTLLVSTVTARTIKWHRGQLHCHSTVSDGDIPPSEVWAQYKSDGYSFVSITDHSTNTKAKMGDTTGGNSDGFLAIPGLEITAAGPHVNAINLEKDLATWWGLQIAIDQAYKSGADLVQLNHPWWTNGKDLDGISDDALKAKKYNLLEVCNADDTTHLPDISVWDTVLSEGRRIFGTGTDDAHKYDASSQHYNECWVTVPGDTLTIEEMMIAMKSGDFYFNDKEMPLTSIDMYDRTISVASDEGTTITFKGKYGTVLKTVQASSAAYQIPVGELYVRAEVTNGTGIAYTQAHFPDTFAVRGGTIEAPDGSKYELGEAVKIDLTFKGAAADLEKIKLYANGTFIGESSDAGSFIWSDATQGEQKVKAKFYHSDGTYLWSNPLELEIGPTNTLQQYAEKRSWQAAVSHNGRLSLSLGHAGRTELALYSLSGRLITTLVKEDLSAGFHSFPIEGTFQNSIYLLKGHVGNEELVQKLLIK